MKKYLIDQDQMTYLLRILRCYPLMHEELKKLKPIELLSEADLHKVWLEERDNAWPLNFARAIEAHIIGEKQ